MQAIDVGLARVACSFTGRYGLADAHRWPAAGQRVGDRLGQLFAEIPDRAISLGARRDYAPHLELVAESH